MGLQTRTVLLTSSTARTTSSTETNYVVLPAPALNADLFLNVVSLTGSAATLLVTIQKGWLDLANADITINQGTTGSVNWIDQWSFTTVTTSTGSRQLSLGTTGNSETAWKQNAIASNTQNAGPLGDMFRIGWQIGISPGSSPSASFSVVGKFYY